MSSKTDSEGAAALVGTVLADRYRVHQLLGEGGMGKVYAAEHVLMRKRLAVKVLHRELCALPDVVARFEREAMASANIEHPNMAAATDFGKLADGSLFLVMELVQGKSLRDEIDAAAMPVERALHIARQIAAALGAAHALGIVHRDLKPENVMLVTRGDDENFVKVLDFGIAKVPVGRAHAGSEGPFAAGPLTRIGEVFGTPEYMAPEQALGQVVDGRADLYALGVILYEMLSGVRPFTSVNETGILAQQLAKSVPTFAARAPNVRIPPRVEAVVTKLLAKEVAGRYQTADEVVQALDELLKPAPGRGARLFTLTEGSPTAFLGSIAEMRGVPAPQAPAESFELASIPDLPSPDVAPVAPAPSGTLPLVDFKPPERVSPPRLKRIATAAREALIVVCEFIEANRSRLPPRVRHWVRKVPAAALLTFALVVVWGGTLVATVWVVSAPRDSKPLADAKRRDAMPAEQRKDPNPVLLEIAEAKKKGHAALVQLAERHPKSAPVLVELAASQAAQTERSAAVATIGKALEADAKVGEQQAVADVLTAAVRKRDTMEAAFALLEGSMGASGARILYDLSLDQKVPASLRSRAERWVRAPEFLKAASPELQVAGALRYAKSCADRHAILPRVGEVGGKRALAYLKIAKIRSGCGRRGRSDCFPCLRKDDALSRAIAAVEKRLADKPDTP